MQREYSIYQLKDIPATRDIRFEPYDCLALTGENCNSENYNLVYSGVMAAEDTLDTLYERFNLHHPAGFTGRSMSISDVVVISHGTGEVAAYYVDSIGFKKLEQFLEE